MSNSPNVSQIGEGKPGVIGAVPKSSTERSQFPYKTQPTLAGLALGLAMVIILGTGVWRNFAKSLPAYTGGGAAAAVGILLVLALILYAPALIMDDSPEQGGEPSTMRILSLAIVATFCVLMLRTGWNSNNAVGSLPSLQNEGNWVWLVTAALGGKALQKFAEIQDKSKNGEPPQHG
jgi:hypothetical protein